MKSDIARNVVSRVKLREVMESCGVNFNGRGFARCPFHQEKTASLSIKNEHYRCFGCGEHGDVIDFVRNYHNLSFPQAIVWLDNNFSLGLTGRKLTYRERQQEAENRRIDRAYAKWKEDIHTEYLTVCMVRSILYGRFLRGEKWLENVVNRLDMLLDTPGEEVRAWAMAIKPI